jgi:hypothetical protein
MWEKAVMLITTTGTITQIKIWQDNLNWAFIEMLTVSPVTHEPITEQFILWQFDDTLQPFSAWIARSLQVALARDALINKLPVSIQHDDASAIVLQMTLSSA